LDENEEDMKYVEELLREFQEKTGSTLATQLLSNWSSYAAKFYKVFPYEYQRALKQMAEDAKKLESPVTVEPKAKEAKVADIEEAVPDKLRGFMKYSREQGLYRKPETRLQDWDEIFNWPQVRKGLKTQAARVHAQF